MTRRHNSARILRTFPYFLALAGVAAAPAPASACGGFFCNATPVVQSGEQIVYVIDDETGSLTMSVRIDYQGAAPEFAWILPVPETPEITLGTATLFDVLGNATAPRFQLSYRTDGTCRTYPSCEYPWRTDDDYAYGPGAGVPRSDAAAAADAGSGPTIYAEGSLGPYETVVIGGATATEIHDWLTTNGYDLPATAIPMLDEYVAGGQRFVALRLRNDATTSEIQPITLHFGGVLPCLPIRLTAIATTPDLPITAFFLASSRAAPRNYSLLEAEPPAALFLGRLPYDQWVGNLVDDMGGRAFITDYAGETPAVGPLALPAIDDLVGEDANTFVAQLSARGYRGDGQLLAILQRFITPPDGMDPRSYYNCLVNGWGACGEPATYDPAGLVAAIEATIRTPRAEADAWIAASTYTTRLYTTMSAEEMTFDPEFSLDPGLDDVTNVHTATYVTECDGEHYVEDAPTHIELPDGTREVAFAGRESVDAVTYCGRYGGRIAGRTPGGGGVCSAAPGARSMFGLGLVALALGVVLGRRAR